MEKVRFGVLGVGRIGKIHAGNLTARIPGAEVTALADVFADPLAKVAAELGVARTFANYRDLLALAWVITRERSSLKAVTLLLKAAPTAWKVRRALRRHRRVSPREIRSWFA
jgi:myo-inositol 2-dehydrogenase/D-chiro-inositol 1-dehydrogenase